MTAGPGWERFREDVLTAMRDGAVEQLARLTWSAERIQREQRERLQTLLMQAAECSPFHRRCLAGIDLAGIDPADLSALPVMTKTQMMDSLDDVFTDRRLRRTHVESALATTAAPVPLLDDYIALASGGCSGQRGVFVLDRTAVTSFAAAVARQPIGTPLASDTLDERPRIAFVAAASPVHATGMVSALTCGADSPVRSPPGTSDFAAGRDCRPAQRVAAADAQWICLDAGTAGRRSPRRALTDHPGTGEFHERNAAARDALGRPCSIRRAGC
ncbi:hypothetical protein [Mycobacterium pseudokansasii]|uniref:hypothetical protein n=1 Tax=Mycobacterium pseudokansasii TaxID=2341080 RepID=UPI0007B527C6|nr:hypothetical protein [Mycobacterium pseudokansasii]KZS69129.1 hypothetical protein A4G27_01210 [Mycobacterium kansasii]